MGVLQQISSTIPNSPKMTVSLWARCNTSLNPVSLFDFGSTGPEVRQGENGFSILTSFDQPFLIAIFQGLGNSLNMNDYFSGDPDNTLAPHYDGLGMEWYPTSTYASGDLRPKVAIGKWFHFFACMDFSIPSVHAEVEGNFYVSAPKLKVFVNCVEMPNVATPDNFAGPGLILSRAFRGQPGPSDPWGVATYCPPQPAPHGAASVYVPGWDLGVSTFPFAIPVREEFAEDYSSMSYADVQIWMGQYIDLSTNVGKFVNLIDGHGIPAPVALATGAFGPQDVLFTGNRIAFPVNRGTGGPFTKIGTINDFSPGPSF